MQSRASINTDTDAMRARHSRRSVGISHYNTATIEHKLSGSCWEEASNSQSFQRARFIGTLYPFQASERVLKLQLRNNLQVHELVDCYQTQLIDEVKATNQRMNHAKTKELARFVISFSLSDFFHDESLMKARWKWSRESRDFFQFMTKKFDKTQKVLYCAPVEKS